MNKDSEAGGMAPEYDFSGAERGRYAGRTYVDPDTPAGAHVVLRRPIPDHDLEKGDVGRIVGKVSESELEVEFRFGSNSESAVMVLAPGDLRLPTASEVLHVRETRTT